MIKVTGYSGRVKRRIKQRSDMLKEQLRVWTS